MILSLAGTAGQLPKPPDDVREAFFWEESIGSLDDEVSEALSRAFPCQLVTDFRLWLKVDSITAPERRPLSSAKPTFESALRFQRIKFHTAALPRIGLDCCDGPNRL